MLISKPKQQQDLFAISNIGFIINSIQINFDELQEIDVEFSSVVHSPSYISDIKSVFNSVSNISSSYDAVTKQVNMTDRKSVV